MTFEIVVLCFSLRLKYVLKLIIRWVLSIALRWILQEVFLDVFLFLTNFHIH